MRSLVLGLLALTSIAQGADALEAFPEAEDGMTRHVLQLVKLENEGDHRIQLILGKTVLTDGVNRHFFGGQIERETISGWGYSYHILKKLGPMTGTLMAAPDSAEKKETFVTLGGEPYFVRYNSKLPLVVYTPQGVEVRYRLWSAQAETLSIPEG